MGLLKRCCIVALCVILCIMAVCGCSKKTESVSARQITEQIKGYCDQSIVWTELSREDIPAHFGFSAENIKKLSVSINDDDQNYDVSAAFIFENEEEINGAIEQINKSMSSATESFRNVDESEFLKLSKRLVYRNGNMLVIAISDNYEKIEKLLVDKGFSSVAK